MTKTAISPRFFLIVSQCYAHVKLPDSKYVEISTQISLYGRSQKGKSRPDVE